MAITNLYPNLPGHLVEFKDGGLQYIAENEEAATGKSLLIMGTAIDGPVDNPVRIDATTVGKLFGSEVDDEGYPNGATLTKYAKQAFKNGFTDVRCMRVTGSQATVDITKPSETIEHETNAFCDVVIPGNESTVIDLTQIDNGTDIGLPMPLNASPKLTIKNSEGEVVREIESAFEVFTGIATVNKNEAPFDSTVTIGDESGEASYQWLRFAPKTVDNAEVNEGVITLDGDVYVTPTDVGTIFTDDTRTALRTYTWGNQANAIPNTNITTLDGFKYAKGYPKVTATHLEDEEEVTEVLDIVEDGIGKYTFSNGNIVITDSEILENIAEYSFDVEYESFTVVDYTGTSTVDLTNGNVAVVANPRQGAKEDLFTLGGENNKVVTVDGVDNIIDIRLAKQNSSQVFEDITEGFTVTGNVVTLDPAVIGNGIVMIYVKYNEIEVIETGFMVRSLYGGDQYNYSEDAQTAAPLGGYVSVTELKNEANEVIGRRFTFVKPSSKKYSASDAPFYFDSVNVPTVGRLRDELAAYPLNNVFEIITDDEDAATKDFTVGTYKLTGGTSGINPTNNEMYEALAGKRYTEADIQAGLCTADEVGYLKEQGAFQILENYHVDYIYVAGVYADSVQTVNPNSSFHNELCLLCAVLSYRTKMTHGFIDVKANSNTTLKGVEKYVNNLLGYNNVHYMKDYDGNVLTNGDGEPMDIGWYTSLVVGPEPIMSSDVLGKYAGSPSIAYAALCSQLAPQSAPTNKRVPGTSKLRYKLSNKQLDALTGNHMVTFMTKNEGANNNADIPYVVDGCTCGTDSCDYRRISTVKVVTDVVDQIREVSDPFLGEPNTTEQRNALSALISKRLSYLLEQGELSYYSFQINATLEQVLLGECTIALTLVVPQELRKITTVVALRAAQ